MNTESERLEACCIHLRDDVIQDIAARGIAPVNKIVAVSVFSSEPHQRGVFDANTLT